MNLRTLWLVFALIVTLLVCIPKLMAEETYVMQCKDGLCIVSVTLLEKLVSVAEHWKSQAMTCKQI